MGDHRRRFRSLIYIIMAKHIEKPTARTFWKITDGIVTHEGYTEINQLTSTGDAATITQSVNPATIYPALPDEGWLEENVIYSYNGDMLRVVQSHDRTHFEPSETPNLFDIIRPNTEGMIWVKNEKIVIGDKRDHNDITYQAINSFTTREGQEPDIVPALWKVWINPEVISVWKQPTGAHDAYQIGDKVYYPTSNDQIWISKINANVTVPNGDVPYNRYWEPFN